MKNTLLFWAIAVVAALVVGRADAAQTALTVTTMSETSAAIPYEAADQVNGNKALNRNGDLFFLIQNTGDVSTGTCTFTAQKTSTSKAGFGTLTKSDNVVTLAASAEMMVGPFRSTAWNDSTGYVLLQVAGDASSAVNIAALRVPAK